MITKILQLCVVITIVSGKMDPICKLDAPVGVDPESCCKVPDLLDHKTLEKCMMVMFQNGSSDISSEIINQRSGQCLFECIFKEHGIFINSTVLTDEALRLLDEAINSDPLWMTIVADAIATCKTIATSVPPRKIPEGICHPEPAFYFGCFHTQLFKNCPDTKWTSNTGCNQLKENAEKCPILTAVISMD